MKKNNNFHTLILIPLLILSLFQASCGKKSTIYTVELKKVKEYLPNKLKTQEAAVKGEAIVKNAFIYFSPVAFFAFTWSYKNTLARFYTKLFDNGNENFNSLPMGVKHNYTINDKNIKFTKTGKSFYRDKYSKHARLSEFSNSVRYSGELWKSAENTIKLNNDSGTYRPPSSSGINVQNLLNDNFPHLTFQFVPRGSN